MRFYLGSPDTDHRRARALTIGNFDGVHQGHLTMLQKLKQEALARRLPASVLTFEPHPREFFKHTQPPARLSTLRDKLLLLKASGLVDEVFVYRFNHKLSSMSAKDFVHDILGTALQTQYLLIGDDFKFGAKRQGDFNLLKQELNGVVEAMPSVLVAGVRASSTEVRNALALGDLAYAAQLLGRPYQLSGKVVHGRKLGRTLGYPTANVHLLHTRPALSGVFVVELELESGQRLASVASLGLNPTIAQSLEYKLEVHIFDFQADLYGQRVVVHFLHKLRDEAKFESFDELIAQIDLDAIQARAFFSRLHRETL